MKSDNLELRDELSKLYKKLLLSPQSKENIMALYVEYLKLMIKYDTTLPIYKKVSKGFITGNCYTYALDLKCPLIFQILYSLYTLFDSDAGLNLSVGFISEIGKRSITLVHSEKELLERLYDDLDFLKIKAYESSVNRDARYGGYKIFVFKDKDIETSCNFHFVRENSDGTLSHKVCYDEYVEKIDSLNEVNKKYELIRTLEIVKPKFR